MGFFLHFFTSLLTFGVVSSSICNPTLVVEFLRNTNELTRQKTNSLVTAQWNNAANITQANEEALMAEAKKWDEFRKKESEIAKTFNISCLTRYEIRQLEKIAIIGTSALNNHDANIFQKTQLSMERIYSTATVNLNGQTLSLEPHLTKLFAKSTNESLLKSAWTKWHEATGDKMRDQYIQYYKLGNKAAKANQLPGKMPLKSFDDLWMFAWETTDLKEQINTLMLELTPLYQRIHAYVRYHLKQQYSNIMPDDNTIPAHLLGNMWSQQWSNILTIFPSINPHPDIESMDAKVNERLEALTVKEMFALSEKFFVDMGLSNMTNTFWKESILEKPTDRNLTCHASAWDFYDGEDFRIKQCTERTINDFVTIHHEMGHIEYYQNYAIQPTIYREGANPGFHEAIGDLISLSVGSPQHLIKVNLLEKTFVADNEKLVKLNLNYQLKMALEKIVFLPFAYVMDRWRWDVFGNLNFEKDLNKHWWKLRLDYTGISPPEMRSEKNFDPGAKYHIPANVEYVRYFVSHVLQFQFFDYLCTEKVRHTGDLYECDLEGNKDAGIALKAMLQRGSSDTWKNILRDFIGTEKMSLKSLIKYFHPLERYLNNFIYKNNITIGWKKNLIDRYMIVDKPTVAPIASSAKKTYQPRINCLMITVLLFTILQFCCKQLFF